MHLPSTNFPVQSVITDPSEGLASKKIEIVVPFVNATELQVSPAAATRRVPQFSAVPAEAVAPAVGSLM